ncbi:MAG: ABC transporter permease [Oscillospiraceae bacterium]|nr:ABC transporter permease [Oscillospiraceae bacterium]
MNSSTKKPLTALQIEKRFTLIRTGAALLIAILVCFLLILTSSTDPIKDLITFFTAPLTSMNRFCTFLLKLSPLLFASCSTCLLFAGGMFNMSIEGAIYIAAIASTAVGVIEGIPAPVHFILMALAGIVSAAIVAVIPTVLEIKFKANLLVSSLMLNYVCNNIGYYILKGPMRDPKASYDASGLIQQSAKIFKIISSGPLSVHAGPLFGLIAIVLTWFLLYRTTIGFKDRTLGENASFAKFSGINTAKTMLIVTAIAGAISGFGASVEISGYYDRLNWASSKGYGWDGIMIAILANNNPKYVLIAAAFLAYIRTSADILNVSSTIPTEIVSIAQAVVIIMIAAQGFLHNTEKKVIVRNSQAMMNEAKEAK